MNKTPKVIILCGKVCSGKSFYAKKLKEKKNSVILSVDELTFYMVDNRKGEDYIDLTKRATNYFMKKAVDIVNCGTDVILDVGLWSSKDRKEIKEFFISNGIDNEIHYIYIDDDSWKKNINERNKEIDEGNETKDFYVTEKLKQKMFEYWEEPSKEEIDIIHIVDRKNS